MSVYDIQKLRQQGTVHEIEPIKLPTLPAESQITQEAPKILQKLSDALNTGEQVLKNINQENLKQTVITNQQKNSFMDYCNQFYDTLGPILKQVPPINLIGSIILQLMAIAENTIQGKKQGNLRQQLVYDQALEYLIKKNVFLDDNGKVLIRGLIEQTFICNENKLKKIFSDFFDVGKSCLNVCQNSATQTLLQNVIPIVK